MKGVENVTLVYSEEPDRGYLGRCTKIHPAGLRKRKTKNETAR